MGEPLLDLPAGGGSLVRNRVLQSSGLRGFLETELVRGVSDRVLQRTIIVAVGIVAHRIALAVVAVVVAFGGGGGRAAVARVEHPCHSGADQERGHRVLLHGVDDGVHRGGGGVADLLAHLGEAVFAVVVFGAEEAEDLIQQMSRLEAVAEGVHGVVHATARGVDIGADGGRGVVGGRIHDEW